MSEQILIEAISEMEARLLEIAEEGQLIPQLEKTQIKWQLEASKRALERERSRAP